MKRSYAFLFLFVIFVLNTSAQFTCFTNPSLEGTPQPTAVPPNWTVCNGIGDVQPGFWGINLPPSNGISYESFLRIGNVSNGYYESFGQQLNTCLVAGTQYFFTVDLAHTNYYSTAGPNGCYSSLAVYGGNASCAFAELLWSSGPFYDSTWQTYTVLFTPSANWCYLSFVPDFITPCGNGTGYINLLMDNLSCINTAVYGVNATGTNVSCYNSCNGTANANAFSGVTPYAYSWSPGGQTTQSISGLCPGTYTVVVTDATSATVTDSVTINQPSQVPFSVSVNNSISCYAYCNGTGVATVSGGTPGYTYVWQPPADSDATVYTLCPGTFTLTVYDNNGCVAIDSGTVSQMPPITANITLINDTLFTSPAVTYQWIYNSTAIFGATQQYYVPTQTGYYSVVVYDSLGCAATFSNFYVSVGVDETERSFAIGIYPNPSEGIYYIGIDAFSDVSLSIEVENVLGEKLMIETAALRKGHSRQEIDLSGNTAGVYFIRIRSGNRTITRKLILR